MLRGREAPAGLFSSMRYDLTCWRLLYFTKATTLTAALRTCSAVISELRQQSCVVFVRSAVAVTSPFQVTGNMAPVSHKRHSYRGPCQMQNPTQPSTWLHTISAAMTHNLYISLSSPLCWDNQEKNLRQAWMVPKCPAFPVRRERWGITRAISSSKFN